MKTSGQFIISRQDATILKSAKELCSMYEERFAAAATNSLGSSGSEVYSFAKVSQAFAMANQVLSSALITATIHGEQDSLQEQRQ